MGHLCMQLVGILLICFATSGKANQQTTIHLFQGGVVPVETIKTNLRNAYTRYFKSRRIGRLSFYLDNVLIIDHVQLPSASIGDAIDKLTLKEGGRTGDCAVWYMDQLEDNASNYILSDLNPCNGTTVVKLARQFLQKNGRRSDAAIIPIGMGNSIHSNWLKQTCGPCSAPLGCVRGWNWFRV